MESSFLWEKSVVIATPAGIGVLDGQSRHWQSALVGPGVSAGQALTPCGGYLCLARLGARGLSLVDLSDPGNPTIRARAFTAGLGWDVAAWGRRAFLAHGILGVGVYWVSERGEVTYKDSLFPGGLVRSVATGRGLLVAASPDGGIWLYSLDGDPTLLGEAQAAGKVSRVRIVAGQLWVLSKKEDRLEVFDLSNPSAPTRLGEVTSNAAEVFHRHFGGPLAFTFSDRWLKVQRAVRVAP